MKKVDIERKRNLIAYLRRIASETRESAAEMDRMADSMQVRLNEQITADAEALKH